MPETTKPAPTTDQVNAEMLAELKRLRAANEKMEKRQQFSWLRVFIVLFLLALITFLII